MANTHSLDLEASSSQYAHISDASQTGLDLNGDFTLECWVKFESLPSSGSNMRFIDKDNFGSSRAYYFQFENRSSAPTGYHLNLLVYTGSSSFLRVAWTPSTGVWYHLAVTRQSSSGYVKFYVNGVQQGTTQTGNTGAINNSNAPFGIGAAYGNGGGYISFFDGLIDDVRVWNDVRTQAEIQNNFLAELTGVEANLVAYWKLNNDYTDETGNGNTLTATGSPVFSTTLPYTGATDVSNTTALSTSLAAYYEMEEESGSRVDSVASYDLTEVNSVLFGTGKQGNAADFELSNSEYLYHATTDTALNPSGANLFTVAAWFNVESLTGTHVIAVNKKTSNSIGDCYKIYVASDGSVNCQTWASSGSFLTIDSGVDVGVGEWHHVAFVKHATNDWRVYVDGVLRATSTSTRSNASTGLNGISIGAEDAGGSGINNYFDGLIDEVGVWTTALTDVDIRDLYNNGDGLPYVGGTAYTQSLDETVTVVDTASKETGKVLNETLVLVDSITRALDRTLSEVITLVDTVDTAQVFTETLDEILTLADTGEQKVTAKVLFEALALVDDARRDLDRTLNETLVLVETVDAAKTYLREFNETVTLAETIAKQANKNLSELLTLVDDATVSGQYARSLDETATIVDDVVNTAGKVLTDTLALVDTIAKMGVFARELDESISLVERFQGLLNGQNIAWIRKYANQAGTFIKRYLDIP